VRGLPRGINVPHHRHGGTGHFYNRGRTDLNPYGLARCSVGSRELLANRNFALLWIGDVLSELGSQANAVALNEARESVAVIGGPPLGGALFGIARSLPFVADTVSFVAAGLAVLGVRVTPGTEPAVAEAKPGPAIREGMSWLWRAPS
jgi:hypothetical protein